MIIIFYSHHRSSNKFRPNLEIIPYSSVNATAVVSKYQYVEVIPEGIKTSKQLIVLTFAK